MSIFKKGGKEGGRVTIKNWENSAVAETWLDDADKNTVLINVDPSSVNCSLWTDSMWSSLLYLAFTFTGMDSNVIFFILDC